MCLALNESPSASYVLEWSLANLVRQDKDELYLISVIVIPDKEPARLLFAPLVRDMITSKHRQCYGQHIILTAISTEAHARIECAELRHVGGFSIVVHGTQRMVYGIQVLQDTA